jgi:hypothetical protein
MKKYIKSAKFFGYNYRYEVHCISRDGRDILLGGSHTLEGAEQIGYDQAKHIFENPWERVEDKFKMLDSMYLYDSESDQDCTTVDFEEQVDMLMSELDSKLMKRVINSNTQVYSVMQRRKNGKWELRYSSRHEDSAWREADKLSGDVKIVYPDGSEKHL